MEAELGRALAGFGESRRLLGWGAGGEGAEGGASGEEGGAAGAGRSGGMLGTVGIYLLLGPGLVAVVLPAGPGAGG